MISAREQADLLAFASANPLQGMPVGAAERLGADWDVAMTFDSSIAAERARREFVQPYLDRFEEATGQAWSTLQATDPTRRQGYYGPVRQVIEQYRREHPDSDLSFPTDEEIDRGGEAVTKGALERRAALDVRPGAGGIVNTAAGFIGGMGGAMLDPVNLASLPIGGAGRTVATRIAGEMLANAGSQAVVEGLTFGRRRAIGGPDAVTAGSVLQNIAEAAVGGAVFAGIGEGIGAGFRTLQRTRAGRDAAHVLTREAEIDAANPFPPGAAGEIAHTEALGRAMEDVQAGRAVDVADITARERAKVAAAPPEPMELGRIRTRGEQEHLFSPAAIEEPDPYTGFRDMAETLPAEAADRFEVHGIVKDPDANLVSLLKNGIDPGREFHSGPPVAGQFGIDSTRNVAPYVLLSDPGKTLRETGVKNVVLIGPAEASAARLQQAFPSVNFMTVDDAGRFMRGEAPAAPGSSPPLRRHGDEIPPADLLDAGGREPLPAGASVSPRRAAVTADEAERLVQEQPELTTKALDTEIPRLLEEEDFDVPDLAIDENGNVVSTRVSARELLKRADDEIATAAEIEACAIGAGGEA